MFRTENNVPQNYIEESRDFQLLSRLYDLTYNGLRYNIDSMINLNDPMKINEQFLPLLGTKVGFITNKNIETSLWRYILSAFSYALKYKGSIKGVRYAVSAILRYEGKSETSLISIEYKDVNYLVISLSQTIANTQALNEFLKYILPAGCVYRIDLSIPSRANVSTLGVSDTVTLNLDNEVLTQDYSAVSSSSDNKTQFEKYPEEYKTNNQISMIVGGESIVSTNKILKSKVSGKNVKK